MKISDEEIGAMISVLKTDGAYLPNVISDDLLERMILAALTVRKRLKREREAETLEERKDVAAKVACPDRFAELAKGQKWDGRMNVWIPWEATATSECPVPEGCVGRIRLIDLPEWITDEPLDHRVWSNDTWPIISAYMVTSIREQGA